MALQDQLRQLRRRNQVDTIAACAVMAFIVAVVPRWFGMPATTVALAVALVATVARGIRGERAQRVLLDRIAALRGREILLSPPSARARDVLAPPT
jgi:hypothetical protein